jgi:carboxypeptidase family protein
MLKILAVWLVVGTGVSAHAAGWSQVATASIKGTVADPSGAVIAGATVTVRQKGTGAERNAETKFDGLYQLEGLEPGEYELRVSNAGFTAKTYDLTFRVGEQLSLNFQLDVSQLVEDVTVTGTASPVDLSNHALTGVVGRSQIENLPLNGRNFLELARLESGVNVVSTGNPGAFGNNYQRVSVNGAQYLQTRVSVDGATVDDRINGGTAQNFSQDAVQEFQIATINFDLAAGTAGSGAINIVSRKGGNTIHGTTFFYYRDDALAAYPGLRRDPRNPAPSFTRRQSGFSVGGPFVKNRLFWFTNIEHNNQDGVYAVANNHPIFSKFDVVHPSPLNFNFQNLRIDGNLHNKHSGFIRLSVDKNNSIAPPGTVVSMPSNWFSSNTAARQIQAALTSVITPRFVTDIRFSHSYLKNDLDAVSAAECDTATSCVGVGGPDILVFDTPLFRMGHHATVPKTMRQKTQQLVGNLTWLHPAHRLRFGGEWEHLNLNTNHAFYDPPQLTLWGPNDLKQNPMLQTLYDRLPESLKDPSASPPTQSEILQLPLRSFTIGIGDPLQPGPYNHERVSQPDVIRLYADDSWTPISALTLTFGLVYLRRPHIYNRDLPRPAYLAPLIGDKLQPPYRGTTSFDPTAGLAWSVTKSGSTLIRAGVGIYRDELHFFRPFLERGSVGPAGNGRVMIDGSVAGLSFTSRATDFTGQDLLQLLPGIRSTLSARLGDGTNPSVTGIDVLKQGDRIFDPEHTAPYAIHSNIGIQQKLRSNLTLSADFASRRFVHYGGFHGVFQLDRNRYNRPKVTGINSSTGEVSFVRDPVIPLCTAAQAAALVPGVQCSTGPINVYGSGASFLYQGLQVELQGRLSPRFQLTAAYTASRNTGFVEFSEYDNYRSAYGNQPDQRRHRSTVSGVIDLPGYSGDFQVLRGLLRNWSAAFISQVESAPPLDTVLMGLDLDGDGISRTLLPGTDRHNLLGRELSQSRLRELVADYNARVESQTRRVTNPDNTVTVIRPRTPFNQVINPIVLPEQFSSGDSFITQDVRLTRTVDLNEIMKLSLVTEVFNVFNVANFSGYSNVLNQLNYGQPAARAGQVFGSGGPRAFQFAARLAF